MTNFNKCERRIDDIEAFLAAVAEAGATEVVDRIPEEYKETYLRAFARTAITPELVLIKTGVEHV